MAEGGLETAPAADPDGIYQLLVEAHRDLDDEQSRLVDVKLALLLANHIGDLGGDRRGGRGGARGRGRSGAPPPADELTRPRACRRAGVSAMLA